MAQRYGESWLTCATSDEDVVDALVLAESLRRTRTTRKISIVTVNVSFEKQSLLWKIFDGVFPLLEGIFPKGSLSDQERSKVFAFSVRLFDKCVFLSPNNLALENADHLFENNKTFQVMKNWKDGSFDTSMFLFTPNIDLCEYLLKTTSQNGKGIPEKLLKTWLEKEYGRSSFSYIPGRNLLKLSVREGRLLRQRTHAPIIQFVECQQKLWTKRASEISDLLKTDLGLSEKLIVEKWLEIFHGKVEKIIKNPSLAKEVQAKDYGEIYSTEPIAVIGMSCRYPGANTLEEFWNLLYQGDEAIREPPAFRWTKEHSLRVSQQERKTNAGFLSTTVDEFDTRFFGVSPKEAQYMDPQARLLHEVLWEALEDSGIDPNTLKGSNGGVFMGSWMNDYKDIVQCSAEKDFFRTYMGNSIGATAARLSFLLGLTGPSIATESGCSSAVVALDLAVKSLRNNETNLAMAGGVNLLLHPFTSSIMDYVIAPDGRCKTFDERANGFGRAEGCGVLVLKRLSDALRDGDNIWAMVRGSAVSQEGISKSLGTPTVHCEALAMESALSDAGVKPEQVSFVETHGTGTSVGDPMEVNAICRAYHSERRKEPLLIGSVKTNVGHTESCSGITGIMKAILAMQHEIIPKHRCLESGFNLNPDVNLDMIPATIPMENVAWPKVKGQPRIAGVSSFGITGTDGHVIIQESPGYNLPKFNLGLERPLHIMKISGKSAEAMEELLESYQNHFENISNGNGNFADAAYTANTGRASFNNRAVVIAKDYEDAVKVLQTNKALRGDLADQEAGEICFLFTGQGSQYTGMAKTLYETSPIFRINFDACDRMLKKKYNLSLRPIMWESSDATELSRTLYSQTAIFVVEYCLLKLWESWGIKPNYVIGHSLGEFAAAVAAGALTFEDALTLVAERSRLIDNLPRGKMLVIKADKTTVDKTISEFKRTCSTFWVDYAALNSPDQTVVAGDSKMIEEFSKFCEQKSLKSIILAASHAFHSRHMDPMLKEYGRIASTIQKPKIKDDGPKFISGMEGRIIDEESINADYWMRHTREKVSFVEACGTLRELGCRTFLEVGPHPVLSSFVMTNNEDIQMNCFPSLRKGMSEWDTMLTTLGKLYLFGYNVDWKGFDETYRRKKVSLPFHPFHRKSFWVDSSGSSVNMIHPLIGQSISNASSLNIYENDVMLKNLPYLKDHCIGGKVVFPGAGYTEMCLSAGYCVANGLTDQLEKPKRAMRLEHVKIEAPLEVKDGKRCRMQAIVELPESSIGSEEGGFRVKVFHQNTADLDGTTGKWILHASADYIPVSSMNDGMKCLKPDIIKEVMSKGDHSNSDGFYKTVDETGLKFGPAFKSIQQHWSLKDTTQEGSDKVVAEVPIPADSDKYLLHPVVLDAAIQAGILTGIRYTSPRLRVPVEIAKLTVFPDCKTENNTELDGSESRNSVLMYSYKENGKYYTFILTKKLEPIALLEDVELLETNVKTIESVLEQQTSKYPDAWEEIWKTASGPSANSVDLISVPEIYCGQEFEASLKTLSENSLDELKTQENTHKLLYLYILRALNELGWSPKKGETVELSFFCQQLGILKQFVPTVRFYFVTMKEEAGILTDVPGSRRTAWKVLKNPPSPVEIQKEIDILYDSLCKDPKTKTVIQIYSRIASSIPKIFKGEESALALLFPTDEAEQQYSADAYYQNHPARQTVVDKVEFMIGTILTKLKERSEDKVFRVLEVGAGTGSLSSVLLDTLRKFWGEKVEYYYTDISQSFFAKAEKKFEQFKNQLKFSVFNLEQSPLEQGIPLNYFDLAFATDVLHATRSLQETLHHIRQTLRPDGYLYFTETVTEARDITFVFGLLEGYWRMEDLDVRPYHACCPVDVWERVIKQSGFDHTHSSKSFLDEFGCITAQKSTKLDESVREITREKNGKKWIVLSPGKSEVVKQVSDTLHSSGYDVKVVLRSHDSVNNFGNKFPVVRMPADCDDNAHWKSLIADENVHGVIYAWGMDSEEMDQKGVALPFLHMAKVLIQLNKPPRLYVLTEGVHAVNEALVENPTPATLFGMAKALKNESYHIYVRCVDLDNQGPLSDKVNHILYELAMTKNNRVLVAYRDGNRYEPRFTKVPPPTAQDELQLPQSTDRYQLVLPKTRILNDVTFDVLDEEIPLDNEIEVKVKAYALNFRDIFTILKPSAEFEKLNSVGLDFSGVVTKVGADVKPEELKVGDRVFGCNFKDAQLPSHLTVRSETVVRIPDRMTFCEAATLPAVFATSYYCLLTVAKMKKGDVVLIHTGSGGVGLSAIQLAQYVGAEIITTAGSPRKRAYLRSLGIKHVFNSRTTAYEEDIRRVTNGRGVDIVLNSITGPGMKEASLNSCAKNARFIEMSKLTIWSNEEVYARRPDVDYSIVDLTVIDPKILRRLLEEMRDFLSDGKVQAIPFAKFDALHLRQALQYFQKAKHIGKVVCAMPEVRKKDGQFKVDVPLFDNDSTYLVTGGLGGIGFEVGKWMLEKGAKNIVLMGRNPPKPDIDAQIKDLNKKGGNLMVKLADVGNYDQIKYVIDWIKNNCQPLRGVMHLAGVLRDNLYANQNWESFHATFAPKVTGTWNLHHLTKGLPLEHFVFYSSLTALMGTPSQPNHAAANCFEDSFAHYRHSLGLPATSINWGQWAQVGCAKEITLSGVLPVSVARMLNGLEVTMRKQNIRGCYMDFEGFETWSMLCPIFKTYLDERLWKQTNKRASNTDGLKAEEFWQEMDAVPTVDEKIAVTSTYLKKILRSGLRLDAEEAINDDADIQDLGVDSLMLIELKNSIQTLLGTRVTVSANLLKGCSTVRQLATAITGRIVGDGEVQTADAQLSPEELKQLLEKDCRLPDEIRPNGNGAEKPSTMKTILLTGSTGTLGPYILSELNRQCKTLEKIVCLVRPVDGTNPADRVMKSLKYLNLQQNVNTSKVEYISGDVTKPMLGLNDEEYKSLSQTVDGVIHCAANKNPADFYLVPKDNPEKPKTDVRSVNVVGTLNILKFAADSKTKRVYLPSLFTAVIGESELDTFYDDWPQLDSIQTIIRHKVPGYQASKFVCESLLKEANSRGIPCQVFRFPFISGESKTGMVNYTDNLYIQRFLSYLKLKAIPSMASPAIVFPVDICANLSLKIFLNDNAPSEVFNIGHPQPQLEQEFVEMAKEEFGTDLEIVELKEFMERLKNDESPLDSFKSFYADGDMTHLISGALQSVRGYFVSPDTFFRNKKLEQIVPDYDHDLPATMDMIKRDLMYVKSKGVFDQFGIESKN